jgi:1,2-phenylacetyl-CoA epoxidase catalytic subunit
MLGNFDNHGGAIVVVRQHLQFLVVHAGSVVTGGARSSPWVAHAGSIAALYQMRWACPAQQHLQHTCRDARV